jgi:hypothetical protein
VPVDHLEADPDQVGGQRRDRDEVEDRGDEREDPRTTRLLSIDDICVLAPLWKLTAERANDDEPGTAPKNAQAMLAAPIPISSWFGSIFWPLLAASPLVIEAASSMPRIEMAIAVPASSGRRWSLRGPKGSRQTPG